MAASNTRECFRECVGKKIKGILFDALPFGRCDIAAGTKTLVFSDGTGLTIASNGSFWQEGAEDVSRAIREAKTALTKTQRDLRDVLKLAGSQADAGGDHG